MIFPIRYDPEPILVSFPDAMAKVREIAIRRLLLNTEGNILATVDVNKPIPESHQFINTSFGVVADGYAEDGSEVWCCVYKCDSFACVKTIQTALTNALRDRFVANPEQKPKIYIGAKP
jgi:hypothetical protein